MNSDVLIAHSGKQHAYKLALSMQRLGRLSRFVTSSYYFSDRCPDVWMKKYPKLHAMLLKRRESLLDDRRVERFPLLEVPELILRRACGNSRLASDAVCVRDAWFDGWVAGRRLREEKIFWGFQGSCRQTLKRAKARGMKTVCEFATAHVTAAVRILGEETLKNPEWADSISNLAYPDWYLKRLREEPLTADICVVASGFTQKSLEEVGVPSAKIRLLPLGADLERFTFCQRSVEGPFQVLFVGGVGQRKGIKYVLDAYERIRSPRTRLKIIGPIVGSGKALKARNHLFEYLGVLPQEEIVRHMHESHVLVLPSLFEGFGLVIPEAMATGMPVIASDRSAGPEIIREGTDGFVIRPDDVDALADRLERLAADRQKVQDMGRCAGERARAYSWDAHTKRLEEVMATL